MKLFLIIEKEKQKKNLDKLIAYFKAEKKIANDRLEVTLKIASSADGITNKSLQLENDCAYIFFGADIYKHFTSGIRAFEEQFNGRVELDSKYKDIHKFSFFVREGLKNYFIGFMPPIDLTMEKPETYMAFDSMMESLRKSTGDYRLDVSDVYMQKCDQRRASLKVDVIPNGYTPSTKILFKYEDVKQYLEYLTNLADNTAVAIDTETNGLAVFSPNHRAYIMSFSNKKGEGVAIDVGCPGFSQGYVGYSPEQRRVIDELIYNYIFRKKKIFMGWNVGFDIFTLCTIGKVSFKDFKKANVIVDGIQHLHYISENRKLEGYGLKPVSRDFLNYAQFGSTLQKWIEYTSNWEKYPPTEIADIVMESLKYAAIDAAAEYTMCTSLIEAFSRDEILNSANGFRSAVLNSKLDIEYNGLLTKDFPEKPPIGRGANTDWDNLISPINKSMKLHNSEPVFHPELFVQSAKNGRLYYGKGFLNVLKMNSDIAKHFVPREGYSFVYFDVSGAELRMAALISQDKNLISDLKNNQNYYEFYAKIANIHPQQAKQFVLSMLNLAGTETLSKECSLSQEEIKKLVNLFYERYDGLKQLKWSVKSFIEENKYIFGASFRKRRFPELDKDGKGFWTDFLSAHNHVLSSSTSDYMLYGCNLITAAGSSETIRLVHFNHDAVLLEVKDGVDIASSLRDCFVYLRKDTDHPIKNGVVEFNKRVLNKELHDLEYVPFSIKLYRGKSFGEMEQLNASI